MEALTKMTQVLINIFGSEVAVKIFGLHPAAKSYLGYGRIITIASSDVTKVANGVAYSTKFLINGLQLVISMVVLSTLLGYYSLIALICVNFLSFMSKNEFLRIISKWT